MLTWAEDLKLAGNNLYLDSRVPRTRCFISHAHGYREFADLLKSRGFDAELARPDKQLSPF